MAKEKKYKSTLRAGQLLASGDVIQVMDQGSPVRCRCPLMSCCRGRRLSCRPGNPGRQAQGRTHTNDAEDKRRAVIGQK